MNNIYNSINYLPASPIVVTVTGSSTPWIAVNNTPSPVLYNFVASSPCHVAQGPFTGSVAATTAASFLLPAGSHFYTIPPGAGIRVIAALNSTGSLFVGNTTQPR